MLNPEVARRMNLIVAEARRHGIRMSITSTWRSSAAQERLYREWVARGRTGLPAARPGLSTHEYGVAFDASFPRAAEATVAAIAARYGLKWFGPRDRVHFDVFGPAAWNALLRELRLL